MLAELGRGTAQARFAALQPDRRSNALVPIPCDDIAAVNGVRAGQGLIDGLHRPGRQSRCQQAIAERSGIVLAEYGGEFVTQRIAIGNAILVASETLIGGEFRLADLLAELAERAVIADADKDVVGAGGKDRIGYEVRVLVAGELRRLAVHEIIRG